MSEPVIPERVPDLYELAFMPGQFRCALCGFQLSKQTISMASGRVGTTPQDRQSEPCPNDGTDMVHVTYREQLEAYSARLTEEFDRRDVAEAKVAELQHEVERLKEFEWMYRELCK